MSKSKKSGNVSAKVTSTKMMGKSRLDSQEVTAGINQTSSANPTGSRSAEDQTRNAKKK